MATGKLYERLIYSFIHYEYLTNPELPYRIPNVDSFGIWKKPRTNVFKVFVNGKTHKRTLSTELMNINRSFFVEYPLEIEKGKLVEKMMIKQGDAITRKKKYTDLEPSGVSL